MLISLLFPKILLRNEKFVDNENEITHTYTSMERVYISWDIIQIFTINGM
jgi:hypothetical protein